jgi:ribonuclease BN (tRNA processing enzyme)
VNVNVDGGGRFTFGADCRPCEELVDAARDTDLLMVEATLPRPERTGIRGHLTASEAGEHARRAGAKRVVLTHISDELDVEWAREQGSEAYGADVVVARAGDVFEV